MSRAPVDDRVLRDIADEWRGLTWVTAIAVRPRNKPKKAVIELESDYYPSEVRQVSVEFEVLISGDFFATYREVWDREADDYRCRWDRHPNDHNSRDHFHEPPDCERAIDRDDFPKYPYQMTELVLRFVERRRGTAFEESRLD
ncbi:hypothetical protein [Halorussus salinus]|uniref:hypothetical protein n=1 Tax=Halorussus salinus TaxID=1364935 RepID=UPI001092A38A|nr:hypothetical protein [Halorussus salinus]